MITPKYHIHLTVDFDFSTGFHRSPAVISTADILMFHIVGNVELRIHFFVCSDLTTIDIHSISIILLNVMID